MTCCCHLHKTLSCCLIWGLTHLVTIFTWSFNSSMLPVIWRVQISLCLFIPITIFPSVTFSSIKDGSTSRYFLQIWKIQFKPKWEIVSSITMYLILSVELLKMKIHTHIVHKTLSDEWLFSVTHATFEFMHKFTEQNALLHHDPFFKEMLFKHTEI